MQNARLGYWWQVLAILTAGTSIYAGIRQFATDEVSAGVSAGKVGALVVLTGAGVVTLLGLAARRSRSRLGAALVMAGVLPAALAGGFGIGIIVGLVASLMSGGNWWWVPVGIASVIATGAGIGAYNAWWHAAPKQGAANRRTKGLPVILVLAGLLVAAVGVSAGLLTIPLLAVGVVTALVGVRLLSRDLKTTS
jgi:hypothetical protein